MYGSWKRRAASRSCSMEILPLWLFPSEWRLSPMVIRAYPLSGRILISGMTPERRLPACLLPILVPFWVNWDYPIKLPTKKFPTGLCQPLAGTQLHLVLRLNSKYVFHIIHSRWFSDEKGCSSQSTTSIGISIGCPNIDGKAFSLKAKQDCMFTRIIT